MQNSCLIPKKIFQTHKSKKYILNNQQLLKATDTWRKRENFTYYFYDDLNCDLFIKENFPNVYEAYKKCPINVMKADIWRYCIIYKYGGIYADADTILHKNPMIFIKPKQLVVAPENNTHFCQWVFAAQPNSPVLKSVIDLCVKRLLSAKEIKGKDAIHYFTGPGVFTDGIVRYLLKTFKKIPKQLSFLNQYKEESFEKKMSGNIFKYEEILIPTIKIFKHAQFHKKKNTCR